MTEPSEAEVWKRRFERERAARKQAESLLHDKSRELFEANLGLSARASALDRYAQRERALASLSTELARTETRTGFLACLAAQTAPLLGADQVSLAEIQPDHQLRTTALVTPSEVQTGDHGGDRNASDWPSRSTPLDPRSAVAAAIREAVPWVTPERSVHAHSDWRMLWETRGIHDFAVVPLLDAAGVIGTLHACWAPASPSSEDRLTLLKQLAGVVAAHLGALRAREALAAANEALEITIEGRTAELRSSEERFASLFEHAPQAMLMVDGDGIIRQANLGAETLFHIAPGELVGRPLAGLVPEVAGIGVGEAGGPPADATRRSSARGLRATRGDGTTFLAEIDLAPVRIQGAPSVLAGINDVTEITKAQDALRQSLSEKVTLLQEIHHRVKNNLQIISSLLFLQQDALASEDAREALQESVFRVRSMALIHETLYGVASLDRIDLHDYTRRLCSTLQASLAPRTRVEVTPGPLLIGIDAAVPVGLILNELVTNAMKYGTPPASRGNVQPTIQIALGEDEHHHEMRVRDNGPGLTTNPLEGKRTGLGLQLVNSLTRQLRGTISLEPGEGTTFHLRWPRQHLPVPALP